MPIIIIFMYSLSVIPYNNPPCEFKYGIYAESASCSTNYLKCADGYPYLTPCEPGLAYDDRTHKCNWPDELLDIGCNSEGKSNACWTVSKLYIIR